MADFAISPIQAISTVLPVTRALVPPPLGERGRDPEGAARSSTAVEGAAATQTPVIDPAKLRKIKDTAQSFEASFLSIMLAQMFTDTEVGAPFGGGQGEQMFKSFLTEAMAKQVARTGGLGIADTVTREMLKLQGLS